MQRPPIFCGSMRDASMLMTEAARAASEMVGGRRPQLLLVLKPDADQASYFTIKRISDTVRRGGGGGKQTPSSFLRCHSRSETKTSLSICQDRLGTTHVRKRCVNEKGHGFSSVSARRSWACPRSAASISTSSSATVSTPPMSCSRSTQSWVRS